MANAREAWSRKNWTGSLLCNSRQGGRGRGPRTPAYSCGRARWRYCIPLQGVQASRAPTKSCRRLGPVIRSPCAAYPSLAPRRRPLRAQNCKNRAWKNPRFSKTSRFERSRGRTVIAPPVGLSTRRHRRAIQPASSFCSSSRQEQQIQRAAACGTGRTRRRRTRTTLKQLTRRRRRAADANNCVNNTLLTRRRRRA